MPRVPTAKTFKPTTATPQAAASRYSTVPRNSSSAHVNNSKSSTKENKQPSALISSHPTTVTTATSSTCSCNGSKAVLFGPKTEIEFIIEKYRFHPSRFTIREPRGVPKRATKRERRHHEDEISMHLELNKNNLESGTKDLGANYVCRPY
ncbi:unnamed protein product [Cyclocybe aegerita]|uniref:Uncharacterized protein n=1 Tax=Cyclocybe aegerita TaxID=1973307 RepID=A0A8S0XJ22_CYCAE|nr:unnamed protein product [Cyclocybe aegerita]